MLADAALSGCEAEFFASFLFLLYIRNLRVPESQQRLALHRVRNPPNFRFSWVPSGQNLTKSLMLLFLPKRGACPYNVLIETNSRAQQWQQIILKSHLLHGQWPIFFVATINSQTTARSGKDQTFVIDFVNDPEEIKAAFQPYFETAELADVSDPNLIHDLQSKLDAARIYTPEEVEGLVAAYFKGRQGEMQAKVAPAVDRYRVQFREAIEAADEEAIDELQIFRKDVGGFIRAYDFLSQIVDFGDTDLEKRSIYFKHLLPWLKDERSHDPVDLSAVKLTHYKLSDTGKQAIKLGQDLEDYKLKPLTDIGSGKSHDPEVAMLSAIIAKMNDLFEGDLSDNDLLALANHVGGLMMGNEMLAEQAAANTKEQFGASPDYKNVMLDSVADGLDKYQEMAKQVLNSPRVQDGLSEILLDLVFAGFAKRRGERPPSIT